ncbi:Arginyl-tRNA--protein transferase [hydrothermal vent metagenome]|uniref:Arginyl-tRNA--protein transferase n=1 Tax=hydrothermal vent metagenome TaxID=652676 RepID=A0A3B0XPM1_9ZZZZ
MNSQNLSLYITAEHECGYYDDRQTANLIPDPQVEMNATLYSLLISKGFRRSGEFVYRPHCHQCSACIPCRINVQNFKPSRNQRRCLKTSRDLTTHIVNAEITDEYYALYCRYMNTRHKGGSMSDPSHEDCTSFLLNNWNTSVFIESRKNGRLLSVAVVDVLASGPSAVYTFFDPEEKKRSLGTFAILQQIWLAQLYKLPHVYLGYWINNHPKMKYKRNFNALELFQHERWVEMGS